MTIWQKILLQLLFLTPLGYILKLINLMKGDQTPGIKVNFETDHPITIDVKANPSAIERIRWFLEGVMLFIQAWLVSDLALSSRVDLFGVYMWLAVLFGLINVTAAVFPNAFKFRK